MKSSGPSLGTLLLVLFIALKLTSTIDWSWWWVLSPLWISVALGLLSGMLDYAADRLDPKPIRDMRRALKDQEHRYHK